MGTLLVWVSLILFGYNLAFIRYGMDDFIRKEEIKLDNNRISHSKMSRHGKHSSYRECI